MEPVRTSNGGGKYDTRKKSSSGVCKINARDSRGHLSEHRAPPLPPSFNVGLRRGSARRGGSQGPQRGPWAKTKAGVYFARPKHAHCCTHNIEIGGARGEGPSAETNLVCADRGTFLGHATNSRAFILQTPDPLWAPDMKPQGPLVAAPLAYTALPSPARDMRRLSREMAHQLCTSAEKGRFFILREKAFLSREALED